MKWVRIGQGAQRHAVLTRHGGTTLCGLSLDGATITTAPGFDDRCGNCDTEWRDRGRRQRKKVAPKVDYRPQFTFEDWEKLDR